MDSVSQFALGAALSVAVMGRRTAVWKAALWGGLAGTLPDLDVVINHGDAILNMVNHRAESHSLLYLSLLAPLLGWGLTRLQPRGQALQPALWQRWTLALWLALFTHPLLDLMTVYGTRLLLPFTDHPYGVGSVFIIDPLYTLPLLFGLGAALLLKSTRGLRWNAIGLAFSTLYLAWGVGVQMHMTKSAEASLKESGIQAERLLVNPTAFNSVLWRLVAMTPEYYYEGFRSLLDKNTQIAWRQYPRCDALNRVALNNAGVEAIAKFSHGFYSLGQQGGRLTVMDLRMGQEPYYFFRFDVGPVGDDGGVVSGERVAGQGGAVVSRAIGQRPDVATALPWLWARLKGDDVALPAADLSGRSMQDIQLERCGYSIKNKGDEVDSGSGKTR
jgi:inner membrane protein